VYLTPSFSQSGTSSSSSIGREALEMSVSPAQNFSKPPPVPDWATVMRTPGFSPWKASWAAWANGPTVLDPSMRMVPERSPPPLLPLPPFSSSSLPQAAAPSASAPQAANARSFLIRFFSLGSVMYGADAVTGSGPSLLPGCRRLVKEM
jgi:hypothetical protein